MWTRAARKEEPGTLETKVTPDSRGGRVRAPGSGLAAGAPGARERGAGGRLGAIVSQPRNHGRRGCPDPLGSSRDSHGTGRGRCHTRGPTPHDDSAASPVLGTDLSQPEALTRPARVTRSRSRGTCTHPPPGRRGGRWATGRRARPAPSVPAAVTVHGSQSWKAGGLGSGATQRATALQTTGPAVSSLGAEGREPGGVTFVRR